jgi:hypothetical protein
MARQSGRPFRREAQKRDFAHKQDIPHIDRERLKREVAKYRDATRRDHEQLKAAGLAMLRLAS